MVDPMNTINTTCMKLTMATSHIEVLIKHNWSARTKKNSIACNFATIFGTVL